eukprot:TRINITY_DN26318_c0_g1_i1.p2 TRINITY_DN26318_c0_g1~~TRINITY_DN26318_c0_g1_i1.p2  ORF type:complete len:104 (-),score=10.68 TRINITY_DN26318_c0_g1_i1:3-314(-)
MAQHGVRMARPLAQAGDRQVSRKELGSARHSLAKHFGDPDKGTQITRHIMLCAVSDKQKCCSRAEGEEAWGYLKSRMKELGLVGPQRSEDSKRGADGDPCTLR